MIIDGVLVARIPTQSYIINNVKYSYDISWMGSGAHFFQIGVQTTSPNTYSIFEVDTVEIYAISNKLIGMANIS